MGCLFSQSDHSKNLRIYRVYNVDENGDELNAGKIEVTESDLILHQRGKEQIRWPLRCLRRYGWDAELFSFESGRRCPTGPGIYAFKCRRAEVLFNSVQECIARAGQEEQNRASQHFEHHSLPNSRPISLVEQHELNGFVVHTSNHFLSNSSDMNYVNGSVVQDSGHNYVNTSTPAQNGTVDATSAFIDFLHDPQIRPESTPTVNYAELDLPTSTENLADIAGPEQRNSVPLVDLETDQENEGLPSLDTEELLIDMDVFTDDEVRQSDYINVGPNGQVPRDELSALPSQVSLRQRTTDHNYSNLQIGSPPANVDANPLLNYIEVAVPKSNENLHNGAVSMTPTSPVAATGMFYYDSLRKQQTESDRPYTEIDFQKTNALKSTSRTQSDTADDGLRKTRHNSTIS